MGQCLSVLNAEGAGDRHHHYQSPWKPPGMGEGLAGYGLGGAGTTPAAPAYTTTANVGLSRSASAERRVFMPEAAPGALQLPRIEEDQTLQSARGQESPAKAQLSASSTQSADKQALPVSWTMGELIGQGAFGSVYLGMDNETGQLMAVKQVSISKAAERGGKASEHIKGLEAEVHLLHKLNHPNIVRYLGTERTDTALNIFLEYVPGGSIAGLLAKFGSFRESVIKVYTKQILLGLEYLHKNGIMHRDIKGANILVDNTGLVKLADFGASKQIEDLATIESGFKSVKGTPYWMAPEVIKQSGHGRQADIWSVACTVIEMATGKPPWSQYGSQVSAMFQIASSKGPPTIPENLSAECKDFLYLCFNRNYKERPSATQLLQHPFLAEVVCRTVAAPLNNIANMVQEPSIKAWRVPKSVRVPSPMHQPEQEGPSSASSAFATPSPLYTRMGERAAGGGAYISMAGTPDGGHTPVSGHMSPLGRHITASRRDAPLQPQPLQPQPLPTPSIGPPAWQQQQQQQRSSPAKQRHHSLRSSAPVLSGLGTVALAPQEPLAQQRGAAVGNSAASSVYPRAAAVADSQQAAGPMSRESSLGLVDSGLRTSNGSMGQTGRQAEQQAALGEQPSMYQGLVPPLEMAVLAAGLATPLRPQQPPCMTQDLIQFPDSAGPAAPPGQEPTAPDTDSGNSYKSDYNPMEEPTWMNPMRSPMQDSPCPIPGGNSPSKPQPGQGSQPKLTLDPSQLSSQEVPLAASHEGQHMVWMDDDGGIDALPWDMGSWGSEGASPRGVGPAAAGEPVGQDVIITALNRRAQLEVRASLALFENVRASMVLSDLGNKPELNEAAAPSPKGAATKGAGWSAQPSAAAAPVAAPSALPRSARSSREDVAAAAPQAGGSNVAVAAPYEAPAAAEDNTAAQYGAREAVWEQELSRELSQLPSRAWPAAGNRRTSMHGSPLKAALHQAGV